MKKLFFFFVAFLTSTISFGQVTVSGSGLDPTYSTLSDAINALNSLTITSPIVITLSGNETAPAGGYLITQLGGTSTNTITIEGNSSTITAGLQTAGSQTDAIFKIIGGDYITIQFFSLQENAGNTIITHASNTMTEFGIALFMNSTTDGAQFNTIKNNKISLSASYQNAIGIFSTSSSSYTNAVMEASSTTGTNSNNKFYGDTISNVAYGIYLICPPIATSVFESGIDIGGSSIGTANKITFGNTTASTLTWNRFNATLPAGISFSNGGPGSNVKYNSITSNSQSYPQTNGIAGIVTTVASAASGVSYTTVWSNNTISLTNNGSTAINGVDFGYGLTMGNIVCSNNTITLNNSQSNAISASISISGIKANYASASLIANNNSVTINQTFSPANNLANSSPVTGMNLSSASSNITAYLNHIIINQMNSPSFGTGTYSGALNGISATSAATSVSIGSLSNGNIITFKQTVTGTGTAAFTCPVTYINAAADHSNLNIQYNTLNTLGSVLRTTGTTTGINHSGLISNSLSITNNTINIDRSGTTATSGNFYGIYAANVLQSLNGLYYINSNSITLASISFASTYGIYNLDGGPIKNFNINSINISGMAKNIYGIYFSNGTCVATSNNITIASVASSPLICGINAAVSATMININNNTFPLINASSAGSNGPSITVIGVEVGTNNTVYSNSIDSVRTGAGSGSATIIGIEISNASSSNVYKNKICRLSTACNGAATLVCGIRISNGTTVNIYNNMIGRLTATAISSNDAIRGINITSTTSASSNNIYFNTIYLNASSSGTNFGTSGIYHTANANATTAALDLRNNIIVNTSTPKGTGVTVAYRRSGATLANYASTSNNNLFYSGTSGSSRLIFYDGTNTDQTLNDFKTRVIPIESSSVSENPIWVSTSGSNVNFLHINTTISTPIESGGINITSYTDDFDGNIRNSIPDIGADEFIGIPLPYCTGVPAASTINGLEAICSGTGTLLSLSNNYTDMGITYQWGFSTTQGGPYTNMGTSTVQATGNLTANTYYICTISCSYSGLSYSTAEKLVSIIPLPNIVVTPASANHCYPGGTAVSLSVSGANTYIWSPAAGLSSTTGSNITAIPMSTTIYSVTGTDGNGCSNTGSTTITFGGTPLNLTASANPTSICYGSTSNLTASTAYYPSAVTVNNYIFSTGTGATLHAMSGAETVLGAGVDDIPTASPDSIGFTFNFDGTNYFQYSVSPDGWLLLGDAIATSDFTNGVTDNTNVPKIYPYWDDHATGSDGNVKVLVTGSAPYRIFIVQWFISIPRSPIGPANSTFQAWLYETYNKIEFRYGLLGTPQHDTYISAGLTGTVSTNFNSITFASNTSSNTVADDLNIVQPLSGRKYAFAPPVPITYSWTPIANVANPSGQNSLTNALTTNTIFTVEANNTFCNSTSEVAVTVNALPAAIAGNDREICLNSSTTLGAMAVAGSTYNWSSSPTGFSSAIAEPTVSPVINTTYTVEETSSAGCTNSHSVAVTVKSLVDDAGPITGPSIITPGATSVAYSVSPIAHSTSYIWTYSGTGVTINGSGSDVTLDFSSTATNGQLSVNGSNDCGDGAISSIDLIANRTLNLTSVMLEGLYDAAGTMNQAQDEIGNHWPAGVADHITIELHDPVDYSIIVFSAPDIPISTTGNATATIPAVYSSSYFITIKHRNSVATTTATAVSFAVTIINQSFAAPANVYGGNLGLSNDSHYLIYTGDVNQDGNVDTDDYIGIDNDSYNYLSGYLDTDVNGDGLIDTGDYIAVDNNNYNYIGSSYP